MKMQRYQKQILLKEFGEKSQRLLSESKVLIIGAGGLGCPVLQYLAAAGVGCIGIVDFDVVEISNLHRQILYTADDIGKSKAKIASEKIKALNPEIQLDVFKIKIDNQNAIEIISGYDLVVDGSDNFPTRYLVNDACVLLGKSLVYGSVFRFEGQVGVFNYRQENIKTNYRDIYPNPPKPEEVADCNEAGVIGVLPGIIGTMQANEAIKIITGIGKTLSNRLVTYNALNNSFYEIEIKPDSESKKNLPKNKEEFLQMNYEWYCNEKNSVHEISAEVFEKMILLDNVLVIDVRNENELPKMAETNVLAIPLHLLKERVDEIDSDKTIVVFCQTGTRSKKAIEIIQQFVHHNNIYNLEGGIKKWKKYMENKRISV